MILCPSKSPAFDGRSITAVATNLHQVVRFKHSDAALFDEVEKRLLRRDPILFKGYARARKNFQMDDLSTRECVDSVSQSSPAWGSHANLLFSIELEVWMDFSFPDSHAQAVYEACLKSGIPFFINLDGPFTPLFGHLLLQKSGFERRTEGSAPTNAMALSEITLDSA